MGEATPMHYAVVVAVLGVTSFILGILAELKKPARGEAIRGKGATLCSYPSDPSIILGYAYFSFLVTATVIGYRSLFCPYNGKSMPRSAFFANNWCTSFFYVSVLTSIFAAVFLIWPGITGRFHRENNIHKNLEYECPTAKTGLLGGGAFVSLNASLFWMLSLMLAANVLEDYFDEPQKEVEII